MILHLHGPKRKPGATSMAQAAQWKSRHISSKEPGPKYDADKKRLPSSAENEIVARIQKNQKFQKNKKKKMTKKREKRKRRGKRGEADEEKYEDEEEQDDEEDEDQEE